MRGVIYLEYTKILVSNIGDDSLNFIDLKTKKLVEKICLKRLMGKSKNIGPNHMAIGKDGLLYLINSYDDSLMKIDIEKLTLINWIKVGRYPICLSLFKDKIYVVNSDSNSISIIDENDFTLIEDISLGERPTDMVIDKEGLRIFIANANSHSISILDLNNKEVEDIRLDKQPIKIIIENNRLFVLSYINNGIENYSNLSELGIDRQETIKSINIKGIFMDMIKIKDKEIFYMLNIDEGHLYRVFIDEEIKISKIYLAGMPSSICWDGKNRLYITNSLSDLLTLVDESTQEIICNIKVGKEPNRTLLL